MPIRAKFRVAEKNNRVPAYGTDHRPTCSVVLNAVTSDSEANKTWAKYTPAGRIEMQIDNPDAYDEFVLGRDYYIDFTLAPEPVVTAAPEPDAEG